MAEVELSENLSRCPADDEEGWFSCPISELDEVMQHFPDFEIPTLGPDDDIHDIVAFSGGVFKPTLAKK